MSQLSFDLSIDGAPHTLSKGTFCCTRITSIFQSQVLDMRSHCSKPYTSYFLSHFLIQLFMLSCDEKWRTNRQSSYRFTSLERRTRVHESPLKALEDLWNHLRKLIAFIPRRSDSWVAKNKTKKTGKPVPRVLRSRSKVIIVLPR